MRLAGKVALITGAAAGVEGELMGFGGAAARLFACEGARVVLTDIKEAMARKTAEQLWAQGGEAVFFRHDVTSEEERRDFHYRCAYCLTHEYFVGGEAGCTIDHHRPLRGPHARPDLLAAYTNLYWCCRECNENKRETWPSPKDYARGYQERLSASGAARRPLWQPSCPSRQDAWRCRKT